MSESDRFDRANGSAGGAQDKAVGDGKAEAGDQGQEAERCGEKCHGSRERVTRVELMGDGADGQGGQDRGDGLGMKFAAASVLLSPWPVRMEAWWKARAVDSMPVAANAAAMTQKIGVRAASLVVQTPVPDGARPATSGPGGVPEIGRAHV